MKNSRFIFFTLCSLLVASCAAKEIKFYVTKPSQFKIENVKYIETGKFVSSSGKIETIQIEKEEPEAGEAPEEPEEPDYKPIEPVINEFMQTQMHIKLFVACFFPFYQDMINTRF